MASPRNVAVLLSKSASDLERFAASELRSYLDRLFGVQARVTTDVGTTAETVLVVGTTASQGSASAGPAHEPRSLSEQGFLLRRSERRGQDTLALLGGSPRAALWAVYDLVEQWGVRYLLHGDVLPEQPGAFWLPTGEVVQEPALAIRQWRVINDFACGPESWSIADYRPVVDQLAKLKFNRLFLSLYPWQPFVHYEHKGIARQSAFLWFDYHYPITDDMVGRELFGDEDEFWNPDLPRQASYTQLMDAGERLIHSLMAYARQRGMECIVTANLTDFMPEFAPLLTGAQPAHQLAGLTVVPSLDTPVDDPALTELAGVVLRATVNTYPEADAIVLGMPEFRQWAGQYEEAWHRLDRTYGIAAVRPLDEVLAAAAQRSGYPGGAARALDEVKGDIVALYFYDRLLNEQRVIEGTRCPDMPFVINSVAEELWPIIPHLLPSGWETMNYVDYTPARTLKRREALRQVPGQETPATLIYTLHDDNVGVLPQLATGSLHQLTQDLYRYGYAGFSTRYWLIGDHDPCVAYLAKAAWDQAATPDAIYRDQISAVWGAPCTSDLLEMWRELEAATVTLEWHGLGLTFPVPGMIMKHWVPEAFPSEMAEVRERYRLALAAAGRAAAKSVPSGRKRMDYWVGRFGFGIAYLDTIEAVRAAALAEDAGKPEAVRRHADRALRLAREALAAYAHVARDQSDRGAIASMNEYVYRPLRAKVDELK